VLSSFQFGTGARRIGVLPSYEVGWRLVGSGHREVPSVEPDLGGRPGRLEAMRWAHAFPTFLASSPMDSEAMTIVPADRARKAACSSGCRLLSRAFRSRPGGGGGGGPNCFFLLGLSFLGGGAFFWVFGRLGEGRLVLGWTRRAASRPTSHCPAGALLVVRVAGAWRRTKKTKPHQPIPQNLRERGRG